MRQAKHARMASSNPPPRLLAAGRARSRRHGFSLLELTVVIGIIMLLLVMAVVGYRYLEATAAKNRTRVVLHDAQAMIAELDRTGGMIMLVGSPTTQTPAPYPYQTTSTVATPGDVTPSGSGRAAAINNCELALSILQQNPANQQAIAQMPAKSIVANSANTVNGVLVSALADGWNNPIIFVPPGGLTGLYLGAQAGTGGTITYAQPGNGLPITSPDNRPFWASAGPDGNFTYGDDNVYSFEK